jgi:hypothetical protein
VGRLAHLTTDSAITGPTLSSEGPTRHAGIRFYGKLRCSEGSGDVDWRVDADQSLENPHSGMVYLEDCVPVLIATSLRNGAETYPLCSATQ